LTLGFLGTGFVGEAYGSNEYAAPLSRAIMDIDKKANLNTGSKALTLFFKNVPEINECDISCFYEEDILELFQYYDVKQGSVVNNPKEWSTYFLGEGGQAIPSISGQNMFVTATTEKLLEEYRDDLTSLYRLRRQVGGGLGLNAKEKKAYENLSKAKDIFEKFKIAKEFYNK